MRRLTLMFLLTFMCLSMILALRPTRAYDAPVIVNLPISSGISTIDPIIAASTIDLTTVQNLYVGLTDIDPNTGMLQPELATSWEVSADGLTWTFTLREDVWWVRYDPTTATFEQIRSITAEDVVYSLKRACDPRIGGYYSSALASVIRGCDIINGKAAEEVPDELLWGNTIAVNSVGSNQFEMNLQYPAAYFPSMTAMPIFNPVYPETASEIDARWSEKGWVVTSGAYAPDEVKTLVSYHFIRNPYLPSEVTHGGDIDQVNLHILEDKLVQADLYQQIALDMSGVSSSIVANRSQFQMVSDGTTFFFSLNTQSPPFDNVHVRRAFSAIIDRQKLVDTTWQGKGIPMFHLTPPTSLYYTLPLDEIGGGLDPAYAREQMALAGYPNCQGFPDVEFQTYVGGSRWLDFWIKSAQIHLGCQLALFSIEQEFGCCIDWVIYPPPPEILPDAVVRAGREDYPDINTWLADTIDSSTHFATQISAETKALILEAGQELDPTRRAELHRDIEEQLFGIEGEFPVVPLFMRAEPIVVQTWLTGPFKRDWLSSSGAHWDAYYLDMAVKQVAINLGEK